MEKNYEVVFFQIPHPLYSHLNSQEWGVVSDTPKELKFDEVFGDDKKCGIRFNCVKPTIPKNWQCKGVGERNDFLNIMPTEIREFFIDVKPTTTVVPTTIAPTTSKTTTQKPKSNCTEKLPDQFMKKMGIGEIAFISVSAFSGILLVIVITLSICYSKKNKKAKVTINEPKKQIRNSTWYDLDISRASRQSSTSSDVEQPPFEYKSVIIMQ